MVNKKNKNKIVKIKKKYKHFYVSCFLLKKRCNCKIVAVQLRNAK